MPSSSDTPSPIELARAELAREQAAASASAAPRKLTLSMEAYDPDTGDIGIVELSGAEHLILGMLQDGAFYRASLQRALANVAAGGGEIDYSPRNEDDTRIEGKVEPGGVSELHPPR